MSEYPFGSLEVVRRTGEEHFRSGECALPLMLKHFWQWAYSDLSSNALRGVLAEYLVAAALGIANNVRVEWNAVDLRTSSGISIEVKSAAYLQSWSQKALSVISFGIQPSLGWDAATNTYSPQRQRQADIYIFALLHHQEKATLDPLNVTQWTFYILPTAVLNAAVPNQKTISLKGLLRLNPLNSTWDAVAKAVEDANQRRQ